MVIEKTKKAFKQQKKAPPRLDDFVSSQSKMGLEMLQGDDAYASDELKSTGKEAWKKP